MERSQSMQVKNAALARAEALRAALVLPAVARGLAWTLTIARRLEPRLERALAGYDAVYELRAGKTARRLVFSAGRITTGPAPTEGTATDGEPDYQPDYEIVFFDLMGALRHLARHPDDVLTLLFENRIEQRGNVYYLFRLGYLLALVQQQTNRMQAALEPVRRLLSSLGSKRHVG